MWMHLLVICAAMNCVLGSSVIHTFPGVVGRVGNGKYTTFDGRSGRLPSSNITILDTSDGFLMEAKLSKKLEIDDIRIAPWAVRVRPGNDGGVVLYADGDEIKATHGKTRSVLTENYVMSIRSRYAHISTQSLYVVFRPTDTGSLDVRVRQLQPLPGNARGILV